jgi:AcrR family transcriptional regulator
LSSSPRRTLHERQAETGEKLFAAASQLLDEVGHEQMTIRMVAQRAGVSPATAYTYFASKDHLFSELFWRLFSAPPGLSLTARTPQARAHQVVTYLASVIAGAPSLAAAVNKSMLASDPEVERLRLQIGGLWIGYFRDAIGEEAGSDVLQTLGFAFSGALLQAGMGLFAYEELAEVLGKVVDVVVGDDDGTRISRRLLR